MACTFSHSDCEGAGGQDCSFNFLSIYLFLYICLAVLGLSVSCRI